MSTVQPLSVSGYQMRLTSVEDDGYFSALIYRDSHRIAATGGDLTRPASDDMILPDTLSADDPEILALTSVHESGPLAGFSVYGVLRELAEFIADMPDDPAWVWVSDDPDLIDSCLREMMSFEMADRLPRESLVQSVEAFALSRGLDRVTFVREGWLSVLTVA